MKYALVIHYDHEQFLKEINQKLAEGWRPQGGLTICEGVHPEKEESTFFYAQALILST